MRVVLDTNVLIAAFVARGVCHELVEHVVREHDPYTSDFILDEFREKLIGKLRVPRNLAEEAIELQISRMRRVEPAAVPASVCRDPDDAAVLGTALAADTACLVTGDNDLLVLRKHRGIRVLGPSGFWQFEAGSEPRER